MLLYNKEGIHDRSDKSAGNRKVKNHAHSFAVAILQMVLAYLSIDEFSKPIIMVMIEFDVDL